MPEITSQTENLIRLAISDHEQEHGEIPASEDLLKRICEAFGDTAEFEYAGWRCVKKTGAELKVRGYAKSNYGWECTHESGAVEVFEPAAGVDIPLRMVRRSLDVKNQLIVSGVLKGT